MVSFRYWFATGMSPLSAFIYRLCSEILSRSLMRAKSQGPLIGIRLAPNLDCLTHLFFADDILLFAAASTRNCAVLRQVLQEFCVLSGQSIFCSKSSIVFSRKVPRQLQTQIESMLGFSSAEAIGVYLSIPLIKGTPKLHHFSEVGSPKAKACRLGFQATVYCGKGLPYKFFYSSYALSLSCALPYSSTSALLLFFLGVGVDGSRNRGGRSCSPSLGRWRTLGIAIPVFIVAGIRQSLRSLRLPRLTGKTLARNSIAFCLS